MRERGEWEGRGRGGGEGEGCSGEWQGEKPLLHHWLSHGPTYDAEIFINP